MLGIFFDIQGIVYLEFIPKGCTVNIELYVDILRCLRSLADFLVKMKTTVLLHPLYSPDLLLCDFLLFPELACRFHCRQFQSSDEVKSASKAELKDMAKKRFLKYFNDLYSQW